MRNVSLVLMVASCCALYAQSTESLTFDVASVKPAEGMQGGMLFVRMSGGPISGDPAQLTYTNVTIKNVLTVAYKVKAYQIEGPAWMDTERFNISAKVPPGTTEAQFRIMLQNLLAERFHLKLHHETKEMPIMALVAGKNGTKLTESKPIAPPAEGGPSANPAASPTFDPTRLAKNADGSVKFPAGGRGARISVNNGHMQMNVNSQPMGAFCDMLTNQLGIPVVDQTGLTANYDFTLEFAPDPRGLKYMPMGGGMPSGAPEGGPADAAEPSAPTLENAIQAQLGLKLERRKGPADMLVIDSVDKTPVEN